MSEEERQDEINKIMSLLTPDELIILALMFHEVYNPKTYIKMPKVRELKMGPENFKFTVSSGRLYQIIEPGHYRPCGGIDFSDIPSVSVIMHEPGETGKGEL